MSDVYNKLRDAGSIGLMQVVQVKPHSFQELKSVMTQESRSQQFKMPRILRNTESIQFLLNREDTRNGRSGYYVSQ